MQPTLKKILRAISLDIRHTLEGTYDATGNPIPGDLETRLNELGVWRGRTPKPLDELPQLSGEDRAARQVIDAYIAYRAEVGVERADAVSEFVREAAYNWANRLLALRCTEARGIIDEVILQKAVYGGRSMVHNRLARKDPEACNGPDEGLFAVLLAEFEARAEELPELFAPTSPAIALRPSLPALKRCIGLLSGTVRAGGQEAATDDVFSAPDALGWAYQYWNTEEKDRVFEKVRTQKGAKIEGADIIPATQLYTEPYMVKFLVQNSLGALWMGMHPQSTLCEGWEYYVKDADRVPVESKPVHEITLLDPACGSGHFLLEAFDLLFQMYQEEANTLSETDIAASILNHNLYGIDIDERSVQIAAAALWMKAKEAAPDLHPAALTSFHHHLVATNIRLPKGKNHLKSFLTKYPEATQLQSALEAIFEGLENVHELGSLVQIEEPVEKEMRYLREKYESTFNHGIQASLFEPTVVQGELPLGIESYVEWKASTLFQLKEHFNQEGEAAEAIQSFFSQSAQKGLALFEILSQEYDVVTGNPPYMGSKNMGGILKQYCERNYYSGRRDLYATFILRCLYLSSQQGRVALLTLHTFLTSQAFIELRSEILDQSFIASLAHLGTGTMKSLSNPNAQGFCMFVLQKTSKLESLNSIGKFIRIIDCDDKEGSLLRVLQEGKSSRRLFSKNRILFSNLPQKQIFYSLGENLLSLLNSENKLARIAKVPKGLTTSNNVRFLRFHWEVNNQPGWLAYAKGGGYRKWHGLQWYCVNWAYDGAAIKNFRDANGKLLSVVRNEKFYNQEGLTYTEVANKSFGVRILPRWEYFDARSPGIFSDIDSLTLIAVLNSRISTYIFRCLSPGVMLDQAYAPSLPIPKTIKAPEVSLLAETAIRLKRIISSMDLQERSFRGQLEGQNQINYNLGALLALLHSIEGELENLVFELFDLAVEDKQQIISETGSPSGWYPLINGYHDVPPVLDEWMISDQVFSCIQKGERKTLSSLDVTEIKQRLGSLYEAGQGGKVDELNIDVLDSENIEELDDTYIPIPAETFLEELSQRLQIHPVSIYWLLKEGIEQEGWRCPSVEKRISEDTFTILILRLLGHRWSYQIEAGEHLPSWVDLDGIIPLTPGLKDMPLLERVLARLPEQFPGTNVTSLEREFSEIMGESLEKWFSGSFFKHHASQFKKRPIAWLVTSQSLLRNGAKGSGRKGLNKAPAFDCLVYYHKLNANTLTTLQSQYVRPLRQSYETELRTLEGFALLNADQSARRLQLEAWVEELKAFEDRLEQSGREGFSSAGLAQYGLDEAVLSFVARWLDEIELRVQTNLLKDWCETAKQLHLHPQLPEWITEAFTHLGLFCSAINPITLKAQEFPKGITSAYLARQLAAHETGMFKNAVKFACGRWLQQLDVVVLSPLREQIKTAGKSKSALQEKLRTAEKQANDLMKKIMSFELPLPGEAWLAAQPLYDQLSSLDEHRKPPESLEEFIQQEQSFAPDLNDGVRVNIAPMQKYGLLAADVLDAKDVEKAIADRAEWRADERRWCREGKLPRPGWWKV